MSKTTLRLPGLTDRPADFWRGKRVLLRAALNVPIIEGKVQSDFRLKSILPTAKFLLEAGSQVIVCGHLGSDGKDSLRPVYEVLRKEFSLTFSTQVVGEETNRLVSDLKDGRALLLENLRREEGEKENSRELAIALAALAAVYVNEAFPASHRAHASIVGLPSILQSFVGFNFYHECEALSKARAPQSPSLFILGGAKFDTKLPLVEKFLTLYDLVFIGGALANDLFLARGYNVGQSLVSKVSLADHPMLNNERLLLPIDVTVAGSDGIRVTTPEAVGSDEKIVDAGPATLAMLRPLIADANSILWNGTLGAYEAGYKESTEQLGQMIAEAEAYSVVGGGDTVTALEPLSLNDHFSFLSTAGGAMLDFLEDGTLPAIEAMQAQPKPL